MRLNNGMKRAAALVIAAATLVSMAACGQANSSDNGKAAEQTYKTQPVDGTPLTYTGKLPMPEQGKAYNNPKDRSELKQGGSANFGISEVGPDWNTLSSNGNTTYMAQLWKFYMPQIWDYSIDGATATPNKNFVTEVKQTSDDPETIEFTINDKATWNDGTPITWKDFESTWKVSNGSDEKYTPAITAGYDQIESVKQGANEKVAVVTFSTPFYPYQSLFMNLYPSQALEGGADMYNTGWQNKPHQEWAAGPYKIKEVSDTAVTFVPNEKWWGDKPLLDTVTFKEMESSASINAFKNGEIDSTGVGTADRLKQVTGMKDAQLLRSYSNYVGTYVLNTKGDALKDVAVRKAYVQAIDREQLSEISYNGMDWKEPMPGSIIMYPSDAGYEDSMPKDAEKADPEKAKKTMEDAGYKLGDDGYFQKDGKDITLRYVSFGDDPLTKAENQAVQKMAKDAGLKVDIDLKATNTFSDTIGNADFDIIGLGWTASDPFGYSSSSYQLYGSDSSSNFSFAGDKKIDELLKKIPQTKDRDEAVKMLNEAEKEYMELYAQVPTGNGPIMIAVKKGLANFGPAGYAANIYGFSSHTENIGWEK